MSNRYKKIIKQDESVPKIVCQNKKCEFMGKYLGINEFLTSRNPMLPHHPFCKYCVNNMIKLDDLQTVYDVLKTLDYPFFMDEWNKVCLTHKKNYVEVYLKRIDSLQKYAGLTYKDSVFTLTMPEKEEDVVELHETIQQMIDDIPVWNEEWQGEYTAKDLRYLRDYYNGLQNDFKIITTNHKDYAKKIAQASLSQSKAYQRLLNNEDGADTAYEKATRIFDMLSKSAQFAESQRGANDVALGCFGRVFDAVEKHNWVPKHTPVDEDMYDKLLKQFANIERSL